MILIVLIEGRNSPILHSEPKEHHHGVAVHPSLRDGRVGDLGDWRVSDIGRSFRRQRLLPWLALPLVPVAAMLLFASHAGRRALDGIITSPQAHALLPDITVDSASPTSAGLIVTSLRSNGPAQLQGIAVGDAVTAIDGRRVLSLDQARDYLEDDDAVTVTLKVVHGSRSHEVRLRRLGE